MNSKQIKYVLELASKRNFSIVAEHFNISQPALSKQIMSLEKELGVKLFDRGATPLKLTEAGEVFVSEAADMVLIEEQLLNSLENVKAGKRGKLVIGVSPFRCVYMMPPVVKKLKKRFSELEIVLMENNSAKLHELTISGVCDFSIINLPVDSVMLDIIPLKKESVVLAVPEEMCEKMDRTICNGDNKISLKQCEKLPFVVLSKKQELRQLFEKMCSLEKAKLEIAAEVVGVLTAWAMVQAGVGAAILPLGIIENTAVSGVKFFQLEADSYSRQPAVVYRKDKPLSKYAMCAVELLNKCE